MRRLLLTLFGAFTILGVIHLSSSEGSAFGPWDGAACNDLMPITVDHCLYYVDWWCTGLGGVCGCPCDNLPCDCGGSDQ